MASKEALYLKVAKVFEDQILTETLLEGDRLPSVRSAQKLYNVSLNTIKQAYLELEGRSLIASEPKKGYFVSKTALRKLALPSINPIRPVGSLNSKQSLIDRVFDSIPQEDITQFALGVPGSSFLPVEKLRKTSIEILRRNDNSISKYDEVQGNAYLRREIAKWAIVLEGKISEDDLVITSGAMNAIHLGLRAVTKTGDWVAVESPAYFGILQTIESLGLRAIEIPTHPLFGVDLDALKKVLPKLSACCFVTNFNNPMGFMMPEENKRDLVKLITAYNVPLIEDDLYGNLYFGAERPKPCKYFDEAGLVMWSSSVSKTIAPGFRVGWTAPGQFKDQVIRQKLSQTVSLAPLFSEVIAHFLEFGRYDHHLRNLRRNLFSNYLSLKKAIENYFPDNTKISEPKGGFMLWLELDKKIQTDILYDIAWKHKINFAPGTIFTQHEQYQNCMRLNFAMEWTDRVEQDLQTLGKLIKNYK